MAFRPAVVDMEVTEANLQSITMPENFGDFEVVLPSHLSLDLLPDSDYGLFTLDRTMIPDKEESAISSSSTFGEGLASSVTN